MTQKSLDKFTNYKLSQMMEGTAFNAITQILETQAKLSPDTAKSMALETIIRKADEAGLKTKLFNEIGDMGIVDNVMEEFKNTIKPLLERRK